MYFFSSSSFFFCVRSFVRFLSHTRIKSLDEMCNCIFGIFGMQHFSLTEWWRLIKSWDTGKTKTQTHGASCIWVIKFTEIFTILWLTQYWYWCKKNNNKPYAPIRFKRILLKQNCVNKCKGLYNTKNDDEVAVSFDRNNSITHSFILMILLCIHISMGWDRESTSVFFWLCIWDKKF